MLSTKVIQSAYVDLYRQLRNYIWDFQTVEKIAELEIAIHQAFPDIEDVRSKFNNLNMDIRSALPEVNEDEDLQQALTALSEIIETDEGIYNKLNQVREVV